MVRDFPVWRREIELAFAILHLACAEDGVADMRDHAFEDVFHGNAVAVCLVDFDDGELGVVSAVEAFIAEVAVHLEYLVKTTDQQALQVELWGDAHVHSAIERVVMRRERARGGAAWLRLHHGRLDLLKAAFFEE